jgi:peptidyl-tRNA hydrolase, PTH1 family
MYVIVGLGNQGTQYINTRHNMGFIAVDAFAKEHNFPAFSLSKKHSALVSETTLSLAKENLSEAKATKVLLAKPQTFMNNSGKAVQSLLPKRSLGNPKLRLVILHDDIDIPMGEIKVSTNRGSAGHKGIESIIQSLGTKNFTRVRIGILPTTGKPKEIEKFVLKKFTKTELTSLESVIQKTTKTLASLIATS